MATVLELIDLNNASVDTALISDGINCAPATYAVTNTYVLARELGTEGFDKLSSASKWALFEAAEYAASIVPLPNPLQGSEVNTSFKSDEMPIEERYQHTIVLPLSALLQMFDRREVDLTRQTEVDRFKKAIWLCGSAMETLLQDSSLAEIPRITSMFGYFRSNAQAGLPHTYEPETPEDSIRLKRHELL